MEVLNSIKRLACFCGSESININKRKFVIRDKIGEGGFACIQLVQEGRRLYALKRITCHSSSDEQAVQQEVRYMKQLQHPNLVSLETSGLIACATNSVALSVVCIVMPFYQGGSLADKLDGLKRRGGWMEEECVYGIVEGLCRALSYLHSLQPDPLAHRDVKPHNVMFTPSSLPLPHPILVDFGSMASAICPITTSQEANRLQDVAAEKCHMSYRCPELFQVEVGAVVDQRVDVWSLGCLLHACCFLEGPFDRVHQRGDSVALAVMSANLPMPPSYACHGYSEGLLGLMKSMLQVEPRSRPFVQDILQQSPFCHDKSLQKIKNSDNNSTRILMDGDEDDFLL